MMIFGKSSSDCRSLRRVMMMMILTRMSLVLAALLCARGGVMGQEMGAGDVSSAIVAALDYRLSEIPEGSLVLAIDRIVIPDGMVRPAHADLAEIARALFVDFL
jgi:hypothetical protein